MSENKSQKQASTSAVIQKPSNLECKDLQEYLKSRPPEILEKFFNYPTICLAVYRYVLKTFGGVSLFLKIIHFIHTGNYQI